MAAVTRWARGHGAAHQTVARHGKDAGHGEDERQRQRPQRPRLVESVGDLQRETERERGDGQTDDGGDRGPEGTGGHGPVPYHRDEEAEDQLLKSLFKVYTKRYG